WGSWRLGGVTWVQWQHVFRHRDELRGNTDNPESVGPRQLYHGTATVSVIDGCVDDDCFQRRIDARHDSPSHEGPGAITRRGAGHTDGWISEHEYLARDVNIGIAREVVVRRDDDASL